MLFVRKIPVIVAVYCLASFIPAFAYDEAGTKVPPGMEIIQVGGTQVLVPEGIEVTRKDGLIVLENVSEYVARQLVDMKKRVEYLEEKQKALEEKIEELTRLLSAGQR